MADELDLLSIFLIIVFVAVGAIIFWVFYQFRLSAKHGLDHLTQKMDELEHQYVRIKPELDELKQELATKVDYDYLESKMHQLIRLITSRQSGQQAQKTQRAPAQVAAIPARRRTR